MNLFIDETQLRSALREIEIAKKHGFKFCLAVLATSSLEGSWVRLQYSDLWEKAHPTDPKYDWGRCQDITKRFKFKNGKLIELKAREVKP